MYRYLLATLLLFGFVATTYAAPVGLTSEVDVVESDLWPDKDFGLYVGFLTDIVSGRDIDINEGNFEIVAPIGRIGVSMLEKYMVYLDLGAALDMEYSYIVGGASCLSEFNDAFLIGIGGSALLYRWNNGIEIGINASYRRADMELEQSTIEGNVYKRSDMSTITDGTYEEYQGAVEVAWRTDYFTPYAGIKLSEVEVNAAFTLMGIQYDANGKNASNNLGIFAGCTYTPKIAPLEGLTLNVEGRLLDEEAISIGGSYRF